ncbi:hypothetical protein Bca4012_051458 [Brassica carinata]
MEDQWLARGHRIEHVGEEPSTTSSSSSSTSQFIANLQNRSLRSVPLSFSTP